MAAILKWGQCGWCAFLCLLVATGASSQELIVNGNFSQGLSGWTVSINPGCAGSRNATIISSDPPYQHVLELTSSGAGGCGGSSSVYQDVNVNVTPNTPLILSGDVKAVSATVGANCGWQGQEYPIQFTLAYTDPSSVSRLLHITFYFGAGTCGSPTALPPTIVYKTIRVPQNAWFHFVSPDLKTWIPSGSRITRLSITAGGWDYVGRADNVSLTTALVDTDGDALPDTWETNGVTIDGVFVNLPAMGANPLRKTIFVEVDWFELDANGDGDADDPGDHSHKPCPQAIQAVVEAFRKAPLLGADGTTGIDLIVDTGQLGGGNPILLRDDTYFTDPLGLLLWQDFDRYKTSHFSSSRKNMFHYALFVHSLGFKFDYIGQSRNDNLNYGAGSSDFIVGLGDPIDCNSESSRYGWKQAGTFMHELGHNLGLAHGGQDHINNKPNYFSVMNYLFQDGLVAPDKEEMFILDYSYFDSPKVPFLDESRLDESEGLHVPELMAHYATRHYCPDHSMRTSRLNQWADWNCNNKPDLGTVAVDLNSTFIVPFYEKLASYNDWSRLRFDGGLIGASRLDRWLPSSTPIDGPFKEATRQELKDLPRPVQIELLYPSRRNEMKCIDQGLLGLAVLTTSPSENSPEFDASTVEPTTARLGPKGAPEVHNRGHLMDVDGDGDIDLLLHFDAAQAGISCTTQELVLNARDKRGQAIQGVKPINPSVRSGRPPRPI